MTNPAIINGALIIGGKRIAAWPPEVKLTKALAELVLIEYLRYPKEIPLSENYVREHLKQVKGAT